MRFTWNLGKNSKLKEERGISFEQVARLILAGHFKRLKNPSKNHPGQYFFRVVLRGKSWAVPFEKRGEVHHLFTIYEE